MGISTNTVSLKGIEQLVFEQWAFEVLKPFHSIPPCQIPIYTYNEHPL